MTARASCDRRSDEGDAHAGRERQRDESIPPRPASCRTRAPPSSATRRQPSPSGGSWPSCAQNSKQPSKRQQLFGLIASMIRTRCSSGGSWQARAQLGILGLDGLRCLRLRLSSLLTASELCEDLSRDLFGLLLSTACCRSRRRYPNAASATPSPDWFGYSRMCFSPPLAEGTRFTVVHRPVDKHKLELGINLRRPPWPSRPRMRHPACACDTPNWR